MGANSTFLANLQMQVQDDLNIGSTPVNRIVPQFVFNSMNTIVSAFYQRLAAGNSETVFSGAVTVTVLYVRNAGTVGNITLTITNASAVTFTLTLPPGGIFTYFAPTYPPPAAVGIEALVIQGDATNSVLYEFMFGY
jgi:hypothetical protein